MKKLNISKFGVALCLVGVLTVVLACICLFGVPEYVRNQEIKDAKHEILIKQLKNGR